MTIDASTILALGGIASAITAIVALLKRAKENAVDTERRKELLRELQKKHNDDIAVIRGEQRVFCGALLAALKGLAELGADGVVHQQIAALEDHLNRVAHE